MELSDFEAGFVLGLLAGEGSFGGTGRQPQVTLRMHARHAKLFYWLERRFPESKLYGPYFHGGRSYFQWMARGSFLRQTLAPLIARHAAWLDDHVAARFHAMCRTYGLSPDAPADGDPGLGG
ncbi:MAG: hypothetical protein HYV09_19565 [Deltaproteobacteria bacterium]|nr:hypothetical protein [Deltaproteobacteria bacterium]